MLYTDIVFMLFYTCSVVYIFDDFNIFIYKVVQIWPGLFVCKL